MTADLSSLVHADSFEGRRIEAIVRREAPALLSYFERRSGPQDAPDLLGETLLVAWRRGAAIPSDDQEARMWLFGVARRVLATSRRSGVRREALADRLREEALVRKQSTTSRDSEVHEALARLSPLDAEIIRLLHWDGFSLVEIAHHLHRREGTIRSRYSRARRNLKEYLRD